MKQRLQKLAYKISVWMQGRYGYDELNRFLSVTGIVLLILSRFKNLGLLYIPGFAAIVWSTVRMYSRKLEKRRRERAWYMKRRDAVTGALNLTKRRWQDRKSFKYFKCSRCGTTLRVPKGKGKIKVTCPKCKQETFRKS